MQSQVKLFMFRFFSCVALHIYWVDMFMTNRKKAYVFPGNKCSTCAPFSILRILFFDSLQRHSVDIGKFILFFLMNVLNVRIKRKKQHEHLKKRKIAHGCIFSDLQIHSFTIKVTSSSLLAKKKQDQTAMVKKNAVKRFFLKAH